MKKERFVKLCSLIHDVFEKNEATEFEVLVVLPLALHASLEVQRKKSPSDFPEDMIELSELARLVVGRLIETQKHNVD